MYDWSQHIIGEDADKVVFTYDDYASKKNAVGNETGTSGSASFYVYGNGFKAENVTFGLPSVPVRVVTIMTPFAALAP